MAKYKVDNSVAMQIGSLAKLARVNIQTIRFYERERLLPEPERTLSGYRRYSESDLDHVRFIKDWQEMGFSLKEIRELIHLHRSVAALPRRIRGRSAELGKIAVIARERLKGIDEKLRLLRAMKKQLSAMLGQIEATETLTCPATRRNRGLPEGS